jgi:protein XagA
MAWRTGVAAALICAPSAAFAGAWTLPQGTGQIIASLFGWTGTGAPWGGQPGVSQQKGEAQVYVQYGLTDRLTIFGQTALERYTLSGQNPSNYTGFDYTGGGLRAKLWSTGDWVFSGEASFYAPGAHNPNSPTEAGNTGGAADARLLAGTNIALGPVSAFVDFEAGYRWRTAGPPNEWHGDATAGLHLPWWGAMILLQGFTTISAPSTNPSFPAWRQAIGQASLVVPFGEGWSFQVGWFQSLYVDKTNTQRGVTAAIWKDF